MERNDVSSEMLLMADASLRQVIGAVAPDALLVDSRIVRRVIRLDRRLKGLGLRVPHDQYYTIDRARLLAFVDRFELEPIGDLAPILILLNRPSEQLQDLVTSRSELLVHYWRLLFQARIRLALERRYPETDDRNAVVNERRRQWGEVVFAEIRAVLWQDRLLFPEPTDWDVYVEFTAVALDAHYFAPATLEIWFPAVADWNAVERDLSGDVQHAELFRSTRLLPSDDQTWDSSVEAPDADAQHRVAAVARESSRRSSAASDERSSLPQRAKRAEKVGNHLKSAIYWKQAAAVTLGDDQEFCQRSALTELKNLVDKLRLALQQDEDSVAEWLAGLQPVLELAASSFWSPEARLLYDLQKICVEFDAESRRANLFGWLRTWGRQPITQTMPLLKFVQMAKHIRSAQRRLGKTGLNAADRQRLELLLEHAEHLAETVVRETIRPLIHAELDRVDLVPANVPERVARNKLVEELLDNLVEYGYLTSSMFRDSLSKGDLKLRDVSGRELFRGDQFLLADRGFSESLIGIYRPAPIYMRWSQRLSSLAFGTQFGRFVTMHLALPLGGAFLTVESVRHVAALLRGEHHDVGSKAIAAAPAEVAVEQVANHAATTVASKGGTWGFTTVIVLAIGLLIYLLMHRPQFRAICIGYCRLAFRNLRRIVIEWPTRLLRIRLVEQLLYGPMFAPVRTYLIKPGLMTLFLVFVLQSVLPTDDFRNVLLVFLSVALFLNSQIGRHADEWFTDLMLRIVEDLRAKVFGVVLQWVLDVFQRLLLDLDRVLHTLDEWSRFRTRDSQIVQVGKFVAGTLWAVIAYFVVLVSTLLIEPQVNPIKHFPVVTVSHKLLLPLGPFFVSRLTPFIGATQANTWVWSTIWLIPGMFGFLVWELRGNWRLYAANRPTTLQSQAVGHHGETMVALLRPTFHSGTLPKLFARWRRASRKPKKTSAQWQMGHLQAALKDNQRRVQHFVERELIELLKQSETHEPLTLVVHSVELATNRVKVAIAKPTEPETIWWWIVWEETQRQLMAHVESAAGAAELADELTPSQLQSLTTALDGLFQRTGVDRVTSDLTGMREQPVAWQHWIEQWTAQPSRP